jgi:predicted LPLAT superfamily acyltransferase
MGDRSYGYSSVEVTFLGDKARFACGGFTIAAACGCPVVSLLSAKLSATEYRIDVAGVFHPRYESRKNKQAELTAWVQAYAGILESYTERHPYQCFLFYDIWGDRQCGRGGTRPSRSVGVGGWEGAVPPAPGAGDA